MVDALSEAWKHHLRINTVHNVFPRDFSLARYPQIESDEEYVARLRWAYKGDCYTSVYSQPQVDAELIDTVFVDVDVDVDVETRSMEETWCVVGKVVYELQTPRLYFSGSKGFHIYLDFPLTPFSRLGKPAVLYYLFNVLKLCDVDVSKIVNLPLPSQRGCGIMARIPYTLNSKSGRYCVPVNHLIGCPFSDVVKYAEDPFGDIQSINVYPNSDIADDIMSAVKHVDLTVYNNHNDNNTVYVDDGVPKTIQWIDELMHKPITAARHRVTWMVIAPYLMNVRKLDKSTAKEILITYLTQCNNVHRMERDGGNLECLVNYFVDYAKSSGLHPPSLKTLKYKYSDIYNALSE